ncbi:MAG TPA: hypothetical protein VMW25_01430 [Clostridia bacterium]|nr:hypothetical protein [Clostridia bacterium]
MSDKLHKKEVLDYLLGTTFFLVFGSVVLMAAVALQTPALYLVAGLSLGGALVLIRLEILIKKTNRFDYEQGVEAERRRWYRGI